MFPIVAPRRPVIHCHPFWQSITTERFAQLPLDRFGLLIRASLQTHDISGMVIQYCQRITPLLVIGSKPPLKIHLPELVGRFMLKAQPSLVFLRFRCIDLSVALQNPMDCTVGRNRHLFLIDQYATDFSSTPAWMLFSYLQNLDFDSGLRFPWRLVRPPRAVR